MINVEFFAQMETLPFTKQQKAALLRQTEMTCDLLWECLYVCSKADAVEAFMMLYDQYPELVEERLQQTDGRSSDERAKASWERFKKRMTEEYGEDWFIEENNETEFCCFQRENNRTDNAAVSS